MFVVPSGSVMSTRQDFCLSVSGCLPGPTYTGAWHVFDPQRLFAERRSDCLNECRHAHIAWEPGATTTRDWYGHLRGSKEATSGLRDYGQMEGEGWGAGLLLGQ